MKYKRFLAGIGVFVFIFALSRCGSTLFGRSSESKSGDTPVVETEEQVAEQETTNDTPEQSKRNIAFSAWRDLRAVVIGAERLYSEFIDSSTAGKYTTDLDLYSAAKFLQSELSDYYVQAMDVKPSAALDGFDDYRLSAYTYISSMIDVPAKAMEYFDDGKTGTLSEFQGAVLTAELLSEEYSSAEKAFLISAGYSDDEIAGMIEAAEEAQP